MKFAETTLPGAYLISTQETSDARGSFARLWCEREFLAAGLSSRIAQVSLSYNRQTGTLRGLHFASPPHEEVKLVRCLRGAIYDVIVDLRPESETYLQWRGFRLTAEERCALYVPAGFAHGFQTLEDATEVLYQISEFHVPEADRGVRYDDPLLKIAWPVEVSVISERDKRWETLKPARGSR